MDNLYLSVAGFNIKIVFRKSKETDTSFEFAKYKFRTELLYYISSFIPANIPSKTDVIIYVSHNIRPLRLSNSINRSSFISHYVRKSINEFATYYQTSIWQFNLMLEDILYEKLAESNGFGIHSSSVVINNNAYLFLGKSGAGKSTIVKLLENKFRPLSDDLSIVKKVNKEYFVYQLPVIEKNPRIWKSSRSYPLKKIFFLHKDTSTKIIEAISIKNIKKNINTQVLKTHPKKTQIDKVICDFVVSGTKFYDLWFEMNLNTIQDLLSDMK